MFKMTLLSKEEERLKTFEFWPKNFINTKELASNGFFYLNIRDIVQCYYCNVQIHNWHKDDKVSEEHKKYSSNCYIFSDDYKTEHINSHDVCGFTDRGTMMSFSNVSVTPKNIKYLYYFMTILGLTFNFISILYLLMK